MANKPCEICGANSYSGRCWRHKQHKQINRIKRPRQQGKEAIKWKQFRQQWIEDNPPDYRGYWTCYLQMTSYCPRLIDIDQLTLEHVIPKSRGKSYKYDIKNIKPACIFCNGEKGSKVLDI